MLRNGLCLCCAELQTRRVVKSYCFKLWLAALTAAAAGTLSSVALIIGRAVAPHLQRGAGLGDPVDSSDGDPPSAGGYVARKRSLRSSCRARPSVPCQVPDPATESTRRRRTNDTKSMQLFGPESQASRRRGQSHLSDCPRLYLSPQTPGGRIRAPWTPRGFRSTALARLQSRPVAPASPGRAGAPSPERNYLTKPAARLSRCGHRLYTAGP